LRAALTEITEIDTDKKLGIVSILVETTDPVLSRAVLRQYQTELEDYLVHKRRTTAGENEKYLTAQVKDQHLELAESEDRLERFMEVIGSTGQRKTGPDGRKCQRW